MRLEMIRQHLKSYEEAKRILASNFTSVAERKAAIHIRQEFESFAPFYLSDLINGLDTLIAHTDGEECADPDGCGVHWQCSRCRLRTMAEATSA